MMELLTNHYIKDCTKTISICLYIDCKNFVQPQCKPTETVTSEYGDPCSYKTKVGCSIDRPFAFKLGGSRLINCKRVAIKKYLANYYCIHKFKFSNLGLNAIFKKKKKKKCVIKT